MTGKQRKFVDAVLAGMTPGEAAKAAGYKGRDAARQLGANPEVCAAISLARQGVQVTRENVLEELGRNAMSREEKTSDKLRAIEVLCKLLGLYDRVGVESHEQVVIVEDMAQARGE